MDLFSELFVYSDQPTTCPYCGARSELIGDMQNSTDLMQVHKCMNIRCQIEFVMIYDKDFDYYHKEPEKQYLFSERNG